MMGEGAHVRAWQAPPYAGSGPRGRKVRSLYGNGAAVSPRSGQKKAPSKRRAPLVICVSLRRSVAARIMRSRTGVCSAMFAFADFPRPINWRLKSPRSSGESRRETETGVHDDDWSSHAGALPF